MRIRKKYQVIPTNAKLENGHSTSDKNGYTCEYLNGALDYSTTEQVVGKWIDNKPIYRKVISGTLPSTANPSNWYSLNIQAGYFEIENCILQGIRPYYYYLDSSNNRTSLDFAIVDGYLKYRVLNSNVTEMTYDLVLKYTKTTDTANS